MKYHVFSSFEVSRLSLMTANSVYNSMNINCSHFLNLDLSYVLMIILSVHICCVTGIEE